MMGSSFSCSCSDPTVLVLPGGHCYSFTAQYTPLCCKNHKCTEVTPVTPSALTFSLADSRPFMVCEAIYTYSSWTLPFKWRHWYGDLGSPAFVVQVYPLPGTRQVIPWGCVFTAHQTGCVYANVSNWISICETNLLIMFLMIPWAAQGADLWALCRDAFWVKLKGELCSRSAPSTPQLPAGLQPMGPA